LLSQQITNPLSRARFLLILTMLQTVKLGVILSDPNSAQFKYWFYTCFQYPAYSFKCTTVHGDVFPMAYSLLWYAVYTPLTSRGYWVFNSAMFTVDCVTALILLRKTSQLSMLLWAQGSIYFLIVSPQDFLVWTLILCSRIRRIGPLFSVLAVMTKFPLLPPILDSRIWDYIVNNPYSVHDMYNWARYSYLIFYWLLYLGLWLHKRRPFQFLVNSPLIRRGVSDA